MALQPVVIEISSDDEDGDTDKSFESSIDWLSELFGPRDGESGKADDVVVVDKLSCAARVQKQNSLPSNTARDVPVDDSDDECQVLDADPDYKVAAIQDKVDGSDDLLIVGEKVLLACRDYPHARHLCAKFPFSTTPHENHCNLCHCYVCDSLAPCPYWGTGVSNVDHCHSSDKEEKWKALRKTVKTINGATNQPQKLPDSTSPVSRGLVINLSRLHGPRLAPSATLIPKPPPLRPCSVPSFGIPNITSQRHHGRPVTQSNLRPRQQLNRHSVVAPGVHPGTRDRRLGHPGISSLPKFKPSGGAFMSLNSKRQQYSDASNIQMNATMAQKNQHPPVSSQNEVVRIRTKDSCLTEIDSDKLQDFIHSLESDLGVLDNSSSGEGQFYPVVAVSSQSELYSHSSAQINRNQNLGPFTNSAPAIPESNMLGGSWPNASSVNVSNSECSSAGYLQMQSFQPSDLPVVSGSHPISGEDPLGNLLASLEQDPAPDVAKDPAMAPLDPSMFIFDFDGLW